MLNELASSNKVAGVKQSRKAIKEGCAAKVFLARDADPAITEPVEEECTAFGVPVEWGFTLSELGRACRLSVGAAVAVILK